MHNTQMYIAEMDYTGKNILINWEKFGNHFYEIAIGFSTHVSDMLITSLTMHNTKMYIAEMDCTGLNTY